jgi:hypothetical protein
MESTREMKALPRAEVPEPSEPEVVRQVRELTERGSTRVSWSPRPSTRADGNPEGSHRDSGCRRRGTARALTLAAGPTSPETVAARHLCPAVSLGGRQRVVPKRTRVSATLSV